MFGLKKIKKSSNASEIVRAIDETLTDYNYTMVNLMSEMFKDDDKFHVTANGMYIDVPCSLMVDVIRARDLCGHTDDYYMVPTSECTANVVLLSDEFDVFYLLARGFASVCEMEHISQEDYPVVHGWNTKEGK